MPVVLIWRKRLTKIFKATVSEIALPALLGRCFGRPDLSSMLAQCLWAASLQIERHCGDQSKGVEGHLPDRVRFTWIDWRDLIQHRMLAEYVDNGRKGLCGR